MNLEDRLIRWLKKRPGEFIAKERIIEVVKSNSTFSSDYISRKLRLMAEEGLIKVEYFGKSNHAHYAFMGGKTREELNEEFWNSLP